MLGRPPCREWTPLVTQQLRLRHVVRIIAYNVDLKDGKSLYFTLHLTAMSAPFFTSEKVESVNPKWAELQTGSLQYLSASGFVVRIWEHRGPETPDRIVLTLGVCLSGLIYLGSKLSDVQPLSFHNNSVIFQLTGGYFTSSQFVRRDLPKPLPFIDCVNVFSDGERTNIFRNCNARCVRGDIRCSYNVTKLQRLQHLQQLIKNKSLDVEDLRRKISVKCGLVSPTAPPHLKESIHTPHLLSMTSLNKLLNKQQQPTKAQREKVLTVRKQIECIKFRTKLLTHEKDVKTALVRQLTEKFADLLESNEDKDFKLMSSYRQLSKKWETLRERRSSQNDTKDLYIRASAQLYLRRKQLMSQLLLIYPVRQLKNDTYAILDIHLPDSESLDQTPDSDLSVALGYITHILVMCSAFLDIPLRYPMFHFGSRSHIVDHITQNIPEKEREFPLFTKSKDRVQFYYAIYLLNKNVAQLRWLRSLPTQDLRATLPNLFSLLQARTLDIRDHRIVSSFDTRSDSELQQEKFRNQAEKSLDVRSLSSSGFESTYVSKPRSQIRLRKATDFGPGLGQILSTRKTELKTVNDKPNEKYSIKSTPTSPEKIPISHHSTKNLHYENMLLTCTSCNVEQGLDLLDSSVSFTCEHSANVENGGSDAVDCPTFVEHDSEVPLSSTVDGQKKFLEQWLESGPKLMCSEENLFPEEILGTVSDDDGDDGSDSGKPLMTRTSALAQDTASFNLVRPKP